MQILSFAVLFFRFLRGGEIMNLFDKANFLLMTTSTGVTNSIYQTGDNKITKGLKDIIALVGGVGGLCFTLAILIIALFIIFGSISPRNIGTWWKALFSCVAGAALFYSAYFLSDVLANLFST